MATTVNARSTTRAMQGARRRHYIREGDWVDSLYKAYLTVIVTVVALFYLSAAFGTASAGASTVHDLEAQGPAFLGLAVAVLAALGLRSGAHGGPLALAAPDVTYLLLAPIPALVFRSAALRQLRGVVLLPTIAGGVAGNIAAGHLDGNRIAWIVAGAAFGALAALLAWGCALIASSRRWSVRRANAIGATLVAWAAIDIALTAATSPTAQVGRVALAPLSWSWLALVGIMLPIAIVGLGLAWIGGTSLEPLRHRAQLVRELRYAATLQDLRSIIVLHRELAQELPRSRPWWRVGHGLRAGACRRRDWQGYARWPFARIARVVVLAGIAGVALVGAWRANDAFLIVAGLAMFLAGVDAAEGLAQEHDHPGRAELIPIPWGQLVIEHIVAPACALAIVAVIGLTVFSVVIGSVDALVVSLIAVVPMAIAAAVGAATSVVAGAPSPTLYLDFPFPEFGMIWLIMRQLIPPAIALTAMVPIAFAHDALVHHSSVSGAAISATLLPIGVIAVTRALVELTKAGGVTNEAPLAEFPALETTDLTKSYGERIAVDTMNLSIERGELVALVGSNGAGKSTLLQLAAGLLDPTSGSVSIEGAEAGSLTARGLVSFIPDQPSLYDDLSVNEHIEYVARLHGLDGRPDTADELLELLELDGRADDLPARFSRGLRQKTSVLLGLVRPFAVLLVDEPFVGLDPSGQRTLVELVEGAVAAGAAVLLATHQLTFLDRASRCIALSDGRIAYSGPVDRAIIGDLLE